MRGGGLQERLALEDVRKAFSAPSGAVEVLRGASLSLRAGEFGVLTGPSGSGKTTLLMVAGLLLGADSGRVRFEGRDVSGQSEAELADLRKRGVGMVFQKFGLLPHRSALENVRFRFRYLRRDGRETRRLALEALDRVGLADRAERPARLLSAGEMQRVAIARALALPPRLLLADEPTGNLDSDSAGRVMELFGELRRDGISILLATHNPEWVGLGDAHWTMESGRPAAVASGK